MTNQPNIRKPKNSFETVKWAIFEPILLKKYSDSLTRRDGLREFLKAYIWVVVFAIILYCACNFITAASDLPFSLNHTFISELVNYWPGQADVLSKFLFISEKTIWVLAVGLAGGLAVGFAFVFAGRFAVGFVGGFVGGFAFVFAFGFVLWLDLGLARPYPKTFSFFTLPPIAGGPQLWFHL